MVPASGPVLAAFDRHPCPVDEVDAIDFHVDKARFFELRHDTARARAYADSARLLLEPGVRAHPSDPRRRSRLGLAYAVLGRSEDAVREGRTAVELLSVSADAFWGALYAWYLVHTYALVGDEGGAIDVLAQLLAVPSLIWVPSLRVDPRWDGLRRNPRFQRLLAGKS
jgi:hypothetical protein